MDQLIVEDARNPRHRCLYSFRNANGIRNKMVSKIDRGSRGLMSGSPNREHEEKFKVNNTILQEILYHDVNKLSHYRPNRFCCLLAQIIFEISTYINTIKLTKLLLIRELKVKARDNVGRKSGRSWKRNGSKTHLKSIKC